MNFLFGKKTTVLRGLAFFSAILIMVALFVSCTENTPPGDETTISEETNAPEAVLLLSEISDYKIVYPEKTDGEIIHPLLDLIGKIEAIAGKRLDYTDDFYREGVEMLAFKEHEILLGPTNRPESAEFLKGLRANDYGYALIGGKIVIAGWNTQTTVKAVELFCQNIVSAVEKNGGDVFFRSSEEMILRELYAFDKILFCGYELSDWQIIYPSKKPNSEDIIASRLAADLTELSGYYVTAHSDEDYKEGSHSIFIGNTSVTPDSLMSPMKNSAGANENKPYIGFDGKNILLYGDNGAAIVEATEQFFDSVENDVKRSGTSTVELSYKAPGFVEFLNNEFTAMSFNVLVSSRSDTRTQRVLEMVKKYLPDTIGFQEVNPSWLNDLVGGLGESYGFVGEGRDGGEKGEYNPIFFNKNKFKLIENGTKWLSDTPDVVSKYSESSLNRILTYALLERISDGKRIMVVNTHLEHTSDPARVKQIKVVIDFINSHPEYPSVMTGDFNCTSSSGVYSTILKTNLSDSMNVALNAKKAATFTNYGASNKVIDYVFITANTISVIEYSVCNEKINGDFPSDHHPVLIKYRLN